MKSKAKTKLLTLVIFGVQMISAQESKAVFHGAGWIQLGRVENSFALPQSGNDYENNWLGNTGGVVSSKLSIDERRSGEFGVGPIMVHLARGSVGQASKWYPFWIPFVSDAKLTYTSETFGEDYNFELNFGSLGYNYNPDMKNLGGYLLSGYTYPGTLVSPANRIFGFLGKVKLGAIQNDFIVNMETEERPYYDISIADVTTYAPHSNFELSLGVNFNRLIPMNKKATSPGKECDPNSIGPYARNAIDNACFIVLKDANGLPTDTVLGSLGGVKVISRFKYDPKHLFSDISPIFGATDFQIYGELGIIGIKDYPQMYPKILRRIPIMLGMNLPGFNFLNASVEVEHYANNLSGDNIAARSGSWIPVADDPRINAKRDNWKWSINTSKTFLGNLALSIQVANDHLRLGGNHDDDTGVEAMRTLEDWYWTSKLAFFF